jgi:hypothetical protein
MPQQSPIDLIQTAKIGVLAGAAGGLAEVAWISLYAVTGGVDAAQVARGVSAAFGAGAMAASAQAGIVIHMALAVLLGLALAFVWEILHHRFTQAFVALNEYVFFLAALTAVWFVNFFVALPLISPDFVGLLPYAISLISKLAFGLAAAATLRRSSAAGSRARPGVLQDRAVS